MCHLHVRQNSNSYYDNGLCIWYYYFWIWNFPEVSSGNEKVLSDILSKDSSAVLKHEQSIKKKNLDKLWKCSCNLEWLKSKESAFSEIYSNYDLMGITFRAWLMYVSLYFKLSTWGVPKSKAALSIHGSCKYVMKKIASDIHKLICSTLLWFPTAVLKCSVMKSLTPFYRHKICFPTLPSQMDLMQSIILYDSKVGIHVI